MIDPAYMGKVHDALATAIRTLRDADEDYNEPIAVWRAARGEAGKTAWSWWARMDAEDLYQNSAPTREAIIAWARKEYGPAARFEICEARQWNDDLEGDEICFFAESRGLEFINPERSGAAATMHAHIDYGFGKADFFGPFTEETVRHQFYQFANQCFGIRKSISDFTLISICPAALPDPWDKFEGATTVLQHSGDTIVWNANGDKIKSEWD